MRERQQPVPSLLLRVGGISALAAGVLFFLTVAYAFGVMPDFGFTQEMFDNRALLLTWVADHAGLYRGLWLLYFASQLFLLPVPLALYALTGQDAARGFGIAAPCAVAGGAAVVMAMVGLIVIYTTSAPVAQAFVEAAPSSPEQAGVLLLGDLFADVGKELRLFSELLLGVWLGGTGALLLLRARSVAGWAMLGIGGCTLLVAILKIFDPRNPLEDFLGLLLAGCYVVIGIRLLRSGARNASRTAVKSATIF
jgi:hypothetical protein